MMATPLCPARTPQGPGRAGFCFPKLGWFGGTVLHLLLQNSIFFLLIFPSCAPRRIMEGRWMTTMTWSLSRSARGRGEAGRMIISESCRRKMGHCRKEGMGTPPESCLPNSALPRRKAGAGNSVQALAGVCRAEFHLGVGPLLPPGPLGDLRLGMILSCCFSWKHFLISCVLCPLVFPTPFQSWRGVFWLVLGGVFYPPECLSWSLDSLD